MSQLACVFYLLTYSLTRLSNAVEEQDVAEAIRLVKSAILSYALDPVTGRIDMDLITTGKSSSFRERASALKKQAQAILNSKGPSPVEFSILLKEINAQSSVVVHEKLLREVVSDLVEEEYLTVVGGPLIRLNSMLKRVIS